MNDRDLMPDRLGEYRLLDRIGEGGMGVVFLARDRRHRTVALKVLRSSVAGDPTARRRLAREVETMQRVRSPNVAEVIDADLDGHTPYIVTRFVPGRTLDDVVTQGRPAARARAVPAGLRARRRPGRGARRRGGAPRRQAGQRDAVPGHARGDRLRDRTGTGRHPAHHDRDVHGHPGLSGPRGDRGPAEQRGLRRACVGGHGGVRGHRPAAVWHRALRGHLLPHRERARRPERGSRGRCSRCWPPRSPGIPRTGHPRCNCAPRRRCSTPALSL